MLVGLIIVSCAALLTVTLLPLSRCQHWCVRVWDFPRLQLAVVATAITITGALLVRTEPMAGWSVVAVAGFCLVCHAGWIIGFTRFATKESLDADLSNDPPRLCLLIANVLMTNRRADLLLGEIREHDPDIFVTLEGDAWWEARIDELATDYPHAVKCPLDNCYGMHVYSRFPLREAALKFLIEEDIPSIHAHVDLCTGASVELHFLHPTPPSPTENDESSERDAELILVGRDVATRNAPAIVCGDMNDVAWSRTTRLFRKISQLLDPRRGRSLCNTFHARYFFMRWPLDHLFHSRHFTLIEMRRLRNIGSDHFPVLVRLAYEPEKYPKQSAPKANGDDYEEAEEKLEKV